MNNDRPEIGSNSGSGRVERRADDVKEEPIIDRDKKFVVDEPEQKTEVTNPDGRACPRDHWTRQSIHFMNNK